MRGDFQLSDLAVEGGGVIITEHPISNLRVHSVDAISLNAAEVLHSSFVQ